MPQMVTLFAIRGAGTCRMSELAETTQQSAGTLTGIPYEDIGAIVGRPLLPTYGYARAYSGLSLNDFICAAKADALYAGRAGAFDRVLVDAPCTGAGTVHRCTRERFRSSINRLKAAHSSTISLLPRNT